MESEVYSGTYCIYINILSFKRLKAYRRGMYGKQYTWVMPNSLTQSFYTLKDAHATFHCSSREKLLVADGCLVTRAVDIREDGVKTISNLVNLPDEMWLYNYMNIFQSNLSLIKQPCGCMSAA